VSAELDPTALAAAIDQTNLGRETGFGDGEAWIEANSRMGFASLCVSPFLVPQAAQVLAGTSTVVCSVAAFPNGYAMTETKAEEAARLVALGCREVDMVVNVGALKEGSDDFVRADIRAVVDAVERAGADAIVKVILETGLLTEDEVVRGCELSVAAGAAFVKTSTGFGPRGASIRDVELMRQTVGDRARVKAAGGVRDLEAALAMIAAGADRLGTSAGADILKAAASAAASAARPEL